MKQLNKIFLFLTIGIGAVQAEASSQSAFDSLKNLKGKWKIAAEGEILPFEMTYDEGSRGSVITEQFGKELSVIYIDGADVKMHHYCNGGNQPHLKLKSSSKPNYLEFETFDVKNLQSPDSNHVKRIIYTIADNNTVKLELVWKKGSSEESEKYVLKKQ